jgi:hypothetical protein
MSQTIESIAREKILVDIISERDATIIALATQVDQMKKEAQAEKASQKEAKDLSAEK